MGEGRDGGRGGHRHGAPVRRGRDGVRRTGGQRHAGDPADVVGKDELEGDGGQSEGKSAIASHACRIWPINDNT